MSEPQKTAAELRQQQSEAYNRWIQAGNTYGWGSRSEKVHSAESAKALEAVHAQEQREKKAT